MIRKRLPKNVLEKIGQKPHRTIGQRKTFAKKISKCGSNWKNTAHHTCHNLTRHLRTKPKFEDVCLSRVMPVQSSLWQMSRGKDDKTVSQLLWFHFISLWNDRARRKTNKMIVVIRCLYVVLLLTWIWITAKKMKRRKSHSLWQGTFHCTWINSGKFNLSYLCSAEILCLQNPVSSNQRLKSK